MTILDEFRRDEARVLDRLVDGELGAAERRELLAGLDDEPGAWRRCALAFLEAQQWRWQMSRVASEPLVVKPVVQPVMKPAETLAKRSPHAPKHWGAWLTVAAAVLVAFSAGRQFAPATPTLVSTDVPAPAADSQQLASDDEPPWQELTLVPVDGNSSSDPIRLRVSADGEIATAGSSPIAVSLVDQLQENGWDVRRAQRWLPIETSDGRRMVVPIEQVDFRSPQVVKF